MCLDASLLPHKLVNMNINQNSELKFHREKEHVWGPHVSDTIFFFTTPIGDCKYSSSLLTLPVYWKLTCAPNDQTIKLGGMFKMGRREIGFIYCQGEQKLF